MDYAGNSNKDKDKDPEKVSNVPPKIVERVIVTDAIIKKRGIGRKFKDLFIAADIKSSSRFVASEVLVPAAKNMILEALNSGAERMIRGESNMRRRNYRNSGPIVTYNRPVERNGYGGSPLPRHAPPVLPGPRVHQQQDQLIILSTREDCQLVLESMADIIENYDVVSMADLHELIGQPSTHVDHKWGWSDIRAVQIRQIREGYLIDFPPAEPI